MTDDREDKWRSKREPGPVVHPVRIDPEGEKGPTRGQAKGRRWRKLGNGLVVPAHVARTVEQRIVEVAPRLPEGGMVTGWASLALQGGGWFDGLGPDGRTELPVPVRIPHGSRRVIPGAVVLRKTRPSRTVDVLGIPCADPETSVLDEMFIREDPRDKVVVMDMAAAGELTSIRRVRARLETDVRRRGVVAVRWALDHASEESWSPPEVRMALAWRLDAGFGRPLQNRKVLALDGRYLGRPDLFDPARRVFGEYNGALHRDRDRHRIDEGRLDKFQGAGLEGFAIVAGDDLQTQVRRMRAAVDRAARHLDSPRLWRVEDPPLDACGRPMPTLDEILDQRDRQWRGLG